MCRPLHAFAATLLSTGLLAGQAAAQLADAPWPKWQRDLRNSGWTPAVGPSGPRVKWAIDFHGISLQPGPAIGPEGELYIGWSICFQPKFLSLTRGDFWRCAWFTRISTAGEVEWEYPLSDFYAFFATLDAQGRLFVVDGWDEDRYGASHAYAFSREGNRLWGPRVNPPYSPFVLSHMTIGRDGTLFYPDGGAVLTAINPNDGSQRWRRSLGSRASVADCPSIGADGTVYTTSADAIWALDPATGAIRWSVPGPSPGGVTGTSIGPDGTVYACFNPRGASWLLAASAKGEPLWEIQLVSFPTFPPSIDPQGRLYLMSGSLETGPLLESYDPNGGLRWRISVPGSYASPVVLDGHNNVYLASVAGSPSFTTLYSCTSEGEFRWEFSEATSALPRYQAPVIGPDGTIYLMVDVGGSEDDIMRFYAFGPGEAPDPAWVGRLKP